MLPLDKLPANSTTSPARNGLLREFIVRQDRPPRDQRVDLPEIQESFRVSFSDAALAVSAEGSRNVLQKPGPADKPPSFEFQLRAYRAIAEL